MRSKPLKTILVAVLAASFAINAVAAQVAAPAPSPVPAAPAPAPAPTPTPAPIPAATPAAQTRVRTGGGGGRRNGGSATTLGGGISFGSGGFSGGSGLGFGIGAAGVALGVGLIGALGRPQTYSGENSTPLQTRVRNSDPDEPERPRRVRTRTTPRNNPPGLSSPSPPPRPGFAVPSKTETRFVPGEVLLVIKAGTPPQRLKRLESSLGLTPLASTLIGLLGVDVRRYSLKPGASVRATVAALRRRAIVTAAQPNYVFELQLDTVPPLPARPPTPAPVQYAVGVLHLTEAHRLATGSGIRVAVIDSGVDETNLDLKDAIVERFDAVGGIFKAHSHGTAMGGAIVAHHTLVGIAPKAKLIAIRAFSGFATGADGTGYNILRGLDFAAAHGARVVNMSFAGPQDLLLEAALLAARQRGIVTVAAAGNAGPLAKPLYPGAEPGTIAVTATDSAGKPFARANRGLYVAVAAPGVDIIAPGLGNSVQITSGTSIATAEASGVIALLLERRPAATPDDIRKILSATARRLTVEPAAAGAGLIDAAAAVAAAR